MSGPFGSHIKPGYNFSLQNITVTGTTTSNGGTYSNTGLISSGGSITGRPLTLGDIQSNGGIDTSGNSSAGGSITVTNSTVGNISANSIVSTSTKASSNGGTIIISMSVTGNIQADSSDFSETGNGGIVTVSSSSVGNIEANSKPNTSGQEAGGIVTLSNSTAGSIQSIGGSIGYANLGSVTITKADVNLSSTTITTSKLTINYTTSFIHPGLVLSALNDLIINGPGNVPGNLGAFSGGDATSIPGEPIVDAAHCNLVAQGTYTLANDITGNCIINSDNITLDGGGHTLNGNVIGDAQNPGNSGHTFTIQNITVSQVQLLRVAIMRRVVSISFRL